MRIGILMGGASREREISFAGGRTVFDTLDRNRFQPVPIFVDGHRRFILLEEQYLYKGTIKDFYPPAPFLPDSFFPYGIDHFNDDFEPIIASVGKELAPHDLINHIDFAFLTLHGAFGEDGTIQGLLEWLGIPYSGTGVYGSALGMDKITVRQHLSQNGFATPRYVIIDHVSEAEIEQIENNVGYPCVVKNPVQGSSIGIAIARNRAELAEAVEKCFFRQKLNLNEWRKKSESEQKAEIRSWMDERLAIGLPVFVENRLIHQPTELLDFLANCSQPEITLIAHDAPNRLLVEAFIGGKEVSVIVIEDENANPVALPPTEIVKNQSVFDYHDKYLSGSVHKYTPARLADPVLRMIQTEAERLTKVCDFQVFARIDGILSADESVIYFNDPNTTSGMLPGSFLFHQAAEVGFTPTRFLTYLIERSLQRRWQQSGYFGMQFRSPYAGFQQKSLSKAEVSENRERIAVVMGGYSSERHISVESGRNVYQKLVSSGEWQADPVFLLHNNLWDADILAKVYSDNPEFFTLWRIPIAVLLKDNADDIASKIIECVRNGVHIPESVQYSRGRLSGLGIESDDMPILIRLDEMAHQYDFVFIALHGRPGEDGYLKQILESKGIPYNGSGVEASELTMDKFRTNERLSELGFSIPKHYLVTKADFEINPQETVQKAFQTLGNSLIAKPNDEGCSTDVRILKTEGEIISYGNDFFRNNPAKDAFLLEELIVARSGERLVEVTVGFVTEGDRVRVFEPSETVSKSAVLTLEEKFLAGEGQNITPARLSTEGVESDSNVRALEAVKNVIHRAVMALGLYGYARIDAFVRLKDNQVTEVIFIEVNSLPGMTPATCIFHQAAIAGYQPYPFIRQIIRAGKKSLRS
jgi:D-alanine-D-alanine ligase